ncbi:uncharacterized protein LOC135710381 [Ochlerotatus camptorhynchus]|uniref:uncharacterized protein LOC135710381 n=1 Tax=Ochlerotatus camptorhynchus TaxID=644619 RepID=UPI0031D3CA7F
MLFVLTLIVCVALSSVSTTTSWYSGFLDYRPFTVRTTKFLCTGQPYKYSRVDKCSIKLYRNGSSSLSFRGTVLKPFKPVYGTIKIWYKSNVNVWRPMLGIDDRGDICEFFNKNDQQLNPMHRLYRRSLSLMFPNSTFQCPYQGTFEFKDFIFTDSMFPPFVPVGSYRNDMTILTANNVTVFAFAFYGTVRAKGAVDLSMG